MVEMTVASNKMFWLITQRSEVQILLPQLSEILQSRHRGRRTATLRPTTQGELTDARDIAMRWIIAFARTV